MPEISLKVSTDKMGKQDRKQIKSKGSLGRSLRALIPSDGTD